jgi:hypothetical protein
MDLPSDAGIIIFYIFTKAREMEMILTRFKRQAGIGRRHGAYYSTFWRRRLLAAALGQESCIRVLGIGTVSSASYLHSSVLYV